MTESWTGPLLTAETREYLTRELGRTIVVCGAMATDIKVLEPQITRSVAINMNGKPVAPQKLLYATDELDLAIFSATVWERDGLSGWNTYQNPRRIDYYAAPHALRRALGRLGSIYTAPIDAFRPSPDYPGQYVSDASVYPNGEYQVTVHDMLSYIYQASHMIRVEGTRSGSPPRGNDLSRIKELPLVEPPVAPPEGWWQHWERGHRSLHDLVLGMDTIISNTAIQTPGS
ncbi:MAG TPA: hypothetical protein VLI54_04655 [Bacillota bacterium]|nr:hypothetical protein [Bacillota bacterium]